MKLILINYRIL